MKFKITLAIKLSETATIMELIDHLSGLGWKKVSIAQVFWGYTIFTLCFLYWIHMIEYNTECDAFFICLTFDFVVNIIFNVVLGIGIKTCQIIIHKGQKSAAQLYNAQFTHFNIHIQYSRFQGFHLDQTS